MMSGSNNTFVLLKTMATGLTSFGRSWKLVIFYWWHHTNSAQFSFTVIDDTLRHFWLLSRVNRAACSAASPCELSDIWKAHLWADWSLSLSPRPLRMCISMPPQQNFIKFALCLGVSLTGALSCLFVQLGNTKLFSWLFFFFGLLLWMGLKIASLN